MLVSVFAWSFRQLAGFWLAAFVFAAFLFFLGGRLQPRPERFFWLLPARNVAHGIWLASVAFFRSRPIEATALIAIPAITAAVTLAWLAARLVRR